MVSYDLIIFYSMFIVLNNSYDNNSNNINLLLELVTSEQKSLAQF